MSTPARTAPGSGRVEGPLVAVLSKRGRFLVAEPLFERRRRVTLDGSIGRADVARDVLAALMLDRGLRLSFPRAVDAEAVDVAQSPPGEAERAERRDLTGLATFTIDPVTARDYDDAVSAEREDGGRIRLWIHIADV